MKRALCSVVLAVVVAGCSSSRLSSDLQSTQLIKSTRSWDGQLLPAYGNGTPEVTILRITIPPGYTLPMHKHTVINAGVLLKGELTVITKSGDVLHLEPYDPIVEIVEKWHYGKNEGDGPAEIIVFYAGEEGEPITIKKTAKEPSHNKAID